MEQQTTDALARRSAQRQAGFLLPLLERGGSLLDCGCDPDLITCGLARQVAPGTVVGIDADSAQVERATAHAITEQLDNVSFQARPSTTQPFAAGRFNVVFAHAPFRHLIDPDRAVREMCRVLALGGIVALRSPDWGGLLLAPRTPALAAPLNAFLNTYYANGDAFADSNSPASCGKPGARASPSQPQSKG